MEKLTPNLTDNPEGFKQEKVDLSKYETSFRRWLVSQIESGLMSIAEARKRFHLPYRFDLLYKQHWQPKYSDEIYLSLRTMSSKERTDQEALEKRIAELEKQLELAKMKNVALNTIIDIAEKDYKLQIRKKSGPKQ
jgi:transposase